MAEKDSLDPSFVHASRLLAEGRTCSPGGHRQLAPVTAAGFGERSWGGRPSPSRRLPYGARPRAADRAGPRAADAPSLPPQLNLGSPELRALWRWRRARLGSLMERREELRGPLGYFHSAEGREINFEWMVINVVFEELLSYKSAFHFLFFFFFLSFLSFLSFFPFLSFLFFFFLLLGKRFWCSLV